MVGFLWGRCTISVVSYPELFGKIGGHIHFLNKQNRYEALLDCIRVRVSLYFVKSSLPLLLGSRVVPGEVLNSGCFSFSRGTPLLQKIGTLFGSRTTFFQ